MTHYLPAFTTTWRGMQRAVCGAWCDRRDHTNEPTCRVCAEYLLAEAKNQDRIARALEAEFPAYKGRLVL